MRISRSTLFAGNTWVARLALVTVLGAASAGCRSGKPDTVAQAEQCIVPRSEAQRSYLPSPRAVLERCFKKAMGEVSARWFLFGAANGALADWFIRYADEIGQRLAASDHYPDTEVAAVQSLRDGAEQINELYRALAAALPTRLSAEEVARTFRSALAVSAATTVLAVQQHGPLDLAASGRASVKGDLGNRIASNYRFLENTASGVQEVLVSYALMSSDDLRQGIGVALWADDRIRTYLMTPGHFPGGTNGSLVARTPPTEMIGGRLINPPLEANPSHLLNFPDLGNPDRDLILAAWNSGALETVADKALDVLGLGRTLDDIKKMSDNRK